MAVGWQVYALTHDPLDLGLIGLAQFMPFVVLILPAGLVADRFSRRYVLTLCYATEVFCGLLLLAFTIHGLTVVWPVFTAMVLFGVARAFVMPAAHSITPNLVPVRSFGNAVAFNSSTFQLATIFFGLSKSFGLSMLALFALGAGDMVSVYIRHVMVQLETPDVIRGRVSAVSAVFIGASNELGEFESGLAAVWFGQIPSVVIGGIATLVVTVLRARWFPELRKADRFPGSKAEAAMAGAELEERM